VEGPYSARFCRILTGGLRVSRTFGHQPVLADEVVDLLAPAAGGLVVDATVGGGGHAARILAALGPGTRLLGLDKDPAALAAAADVLAAYGTQVSLRRNDFRHIAAAVHEQGQESVQAILVDLGVSSPQLDWPERGFSYRHDAPLDMRMDPDAPLSAAEVVAGYDEDALASVISRYGEEKFARRIAAAIVERRAVSPLRTTGELAEIVRSAIPAAARRHGRHPARRTFQALRVEVNDELGALADALRDGPPLLAPGGVLAVISYHSLEDRMVKREFRSRCSVTRPPRGVPVRDEPVAPFELATRGAVVPSAREIAENPRSESARLRALRRRVP